MRIAVGRQPKRFRLRLGPRPPWPVDQFEATLKPSAWLKLLQLTTTSAYALPPPAGAAKTISPLGSTTARSGADNGASFSHLQTFDPPEGALLADQPTIFAGPGELDTQTGIRKEALWLTYHTATIIFVPPATFTQAYGFPKVHSAEIRGRGPSDVGPFDQQHTFDLEGALADISLGPTGEVLVAYSRADGSGAVNRPIVICHDPDGRGTNAGFSPCSLTPFDTGALNFPDISIGYDRSSATNARAYLIYTHRSVGSSDPNLFLRTCDTTSHPACSGATSWSASELVNDDTTTARQSLPWMDVDPASGVVGISWYDTRGDPANLAAEVYAAARAAGASGTFSPNRLVSTLPEASNGDYGDYTGLSFFGGVFFPSWADNSQSSSNLDAYVAPVSVLEGSDGDADGIPDTIDNCATQPNANQYDADLDGYGNRCDADFDQTYLVSIGDFNAFRVCQGSSDPSCAEMDLDGDGTVEEGDDFAIFSALYGKAPGPSGSKCKKLPPRDRSCL